MPFPRLDLQPRGCAGCRAQRGKSPILGFNQVRTNVIVIITDDQGYGDVGFNGNPIVQTPILDAFAADAVVFDRFYANPVCSPTRASIMMGKYPARLDLTIWLGGRGGAPAVEHLSLEETTIAETLRKAGYVTAMGAGR